MQVKFKIAAPLQNLLRKQQKNRAPVNKSYNSLMTQSLHPALYGDDKARDTFSGRFSMSVLHAALLMRRLRENGQAGSDLAQSLFDTLFKGFDDALREIGVGDTAVGKRIKHMAQKFYGAANAYDSALNEGAPEKELPEALGRNLDLSPQALPDISNYVRQTVKQLAKQKNDSLLQGQINWPDASTFFPKK